MHRGGERGFSNLYSRRGPLQLAGDALITRLGIGRVRPSLGRTHPRGVILVVQYACATRSKANFMGARESDAPMGNIYIGYFFFL